ncbi:MAG: lysostaphin resistance A-like protein [Nocardioidaceae bacterium]
MRLPTSAAVAAVLLLLVGVKLLDRTQPTSVHAVVHLAAAVAILGVARSSGLSWESVGLGRGSFRRGFAYAVPVVVVVAVAYVVLLAFPWSRGMLLDERFRQPLSQALVAALVLVPLRTVIFEEVAFRGVLWGLVQRVRGPVWATAVSSMLFGAWHVVSALSFAGSTGLVGERGSAESGVVATTVVFTAAAGVLLCELRRRSGSLIPAVALHWSVNGLGIVAVAMAWSLNR